MEGLPTHYPDVFFGLTNPSLPPWERAQGQLERADYWGIIWRDRRIERGRRRETPAEQLCDGLQRRAFPAPMAVQEVP
jgi:hypothetical protein